MLACSNCPASNGLILRSADDTPTIVIETNVVYEACVTCELLHASRGLGSEKLDLVLVDGTCRDVFVIERGCDVQNSLVKPSHCLKMLACRCIPRFDQTITSTSVQNLTIPAKSEAGSFDVVSTGLPLDTCWNGSLLDLRSQIFWLD